jgi:hypothetical protein
MRHLVRCLMAVALMALPPILGAAAQPAAAQGIDLTCPASLTVNLSPGLTLLPRPQTITGVAKVGTAVSPITPCTSLTGTPYQGATGRVRGTGSVGCVGGTATGTIRATWNNGDTSTIAWSVVAGFPAPIVTAHVTAGALKGATLLVTGVPTGITGICLIPVTSVSGVGLVEILSL